MDAITENVSCVIGGIDVVPVASHAERLECKANLLVATGGEGSRGQQHAGAIAMSVHGGVYEN